MKSFVAAAITCLLATVVGLGCAGTNAGGSSAADGGAGDDGGDDASGDDASASDGGTDAPADKLTWTFIYDTYFGKSTPGHCGNAGCHGTARAGFVCSSKAICYTSITTSNPNVGGRMVNPQMPSASVFLDPANSPLFWFNEAGGNMPQGALTANAAAKADITAWINAGAQNN